MNPDLQLLVALGIVFVAGGFAVRGLIQGFLALHRKPCAGGGCGGCSVTQQEPTGRFPLHQVEK